MQAIQFIIGAAVVATALTVPLQDPVPVPPTFPESDFDPFENATAPDCTANTTGVDLYGNRNGIVDARFKWTKFYVLPDIRYNQQELNAIHKAMVNLQRVLPCVEFGIYPQNSQPAGDYIRIDKGVGCGSLAGRHGGMQPMTLQSPGCMTNGIIEHEMMHALGVLHEHQRMDRDDHVTIIRENITPGFEKDFDKAPGYSPYGVPYNVNSIMHYDSFAHSRNKRPTMVAKNGQTIGSKGVLQQTDIQKLQAIYKCK